MGVRFTGTFKPWIDDDGSQEVVVDVHDNNGGGAQEIRIEDCHVFTESGARDPLDPFIPGRCELTFLIEDESMLTFITDIANTVEDRFYIVCSENGFQTFVGVVTHDFITYPDLPFPFPFTLNAVDGLSRTKDVDYLDENGDPYEDIDTGNFFSCMDHIFNCFSKLNLSIYDVYYNPKHIWVHCYWYDLNMANTSENPLEQAYISADLFYSYDNEGNLISESCYDVLLAILHAFGLQIKYVKGIYIIWQPSSLSVGSGFTTNLFWNYRVDGASSGQRNQSFTREIDKVNIYPKYQGNWHFLPPVRQIKVVYSYDKQVKVLEPPDAELAWGGNSIGAGTCWRGKDGFASGNLIRPLAIFANSDVEGAPVWRFHSQFYVQTDMVNGEFYEWLDHKYIIHIQLGVRVVTSVGDQEFVYQRLQDLTYDNPDIQDAEWVSASLFGGSSITAVGYYWTSPALTIDRRGSRGAYFDMGFETTPLEVDTEGEIRSYDPFLCITLAKVVTPDGDLPLSAATSPDLTFEVQFSASDIKVIIAQDNKNAKPTLKTVEHVSSINEGGKDSITINTRIGDRGTTSAIRVSDGSDLIPTGGWGVGAGSSGVLIGDLLAEEVHKVRGNAIRIMNRTVIGRENLSVDASNIFEYDLGFFLSMNTDHNYYNQEITGSWWALRDTLVYPSGATARARSIDREYNRLDETYPGTGYADPKYHSVGVDGDGFTAPATEYVFDDNGVLLPNKDYYSTYQIGKMVDVQINGNHLRYVDENPTGPREYTINNTNNSIVLDSNFPLSERHDIQVFLRKIA